ncbi:tape measure protein [Spirosoma agri]
MLGFTSSTIRETSKIDQQFSRLGQLAAGYFSFQALSQLPAQILKTRSEFQSLEIAFTTMLRSKTKAEALLSDTRNFATNTPFGLKEAANGAKQLLAYGFAAKDLIPTLSRLGDISAGLGLPLERLTFLYGTTKTQGRLFAQDLNQFVGSGIPLISELAKQFGVGEEAVRKLVEEGKVGFPEVKKAIESMTSTGGLFAGTLDAQSKSLNGLRERLSDAYEGMLNDIGKQNEEIIGGVLTTVTEAVLHYQDFIEILQVVVATYGAYKAALLLSNVAQLKDIAFTEAQAIAKAQAANSLGFLTLSQTKAAASTALLTRAQVLLNGSLLANPYVLIATALAGLAAAYFTFREEALEVKSAQFLLSESSKGVSTDLRKQSIEVTSLTGILKNQNVAESERRAAYDKINAITPDILKGLDYEKAKTADLTKEVNLYLASLEKKIRLEAAQGALKSAIEQDIEAAEKLKKAEDDLVRKRADAKKKPTLPTGPDARGGGVGAFQDANAAQRELEQAIETKKKTGDVINQINGNISTLYKAGTKDAINAEIQRLETVRGSIDKLSPAYKDNEIRLAELTKQRDALNSSETKGHAVQAITIEYLDAEIKKKKESLDLNKGDKANAQIRKEIETLEAQKRRLTGDKTKAEKDADKVGPYGSVSYWENISKKAQEILDRTPADQKGKIAQQQAIKLNADQMAEEARKKIATRSFDEEISYKREQYELYQRWVDAYGKQAADTQFAELIKSGQGYLDYLNTQIAALEAKKSSGKLSPTDTKNLSGLLDQRNDITAKKSGIDLFREGLEKARNESTTLAGYLSVLKQKQEELNAKPDTKEYFELRRQVAEQIVGTQQDLRTQLGQYLADVTGSEEQRLAITRKYADLRAGLLEQYQGKRTSVGKVGEYQGKLGQLNQGEADEIKEVNERAVQASKAFKKLDEVILESGRAAMKKRLALLNDALEKEKLLADTQEYQSKLKERNDLQLAIKDDDLSRINEYGQLVAQLGEAYMQLGGEIGDAGAFMSGFASNLSMITAAFKENMTAAEGMQLILSATVNIVSSITSAAAQRKQAEEAYYASVIAQQKEYNQLLNEQIGMQAEQNENVFTKDYEGRLKDRFAQLQGATKGYMESLRKLSEGQAKTGQRDKVDWGAVGKNAASGAAIGTAIAGPIGTAIGAIAGGLIGLFGAKKKADEFASLLGTYPELISKTKDGQTEFNKELATTLINQGLVDDKTKALLQDTLDWADQMEKAKAAIKEIVRDLVGGLGDKLRDNLVNAFKEGTDAATAFGSAVSDILENLVTKMLFSQAFNGVLTDLQEEMSKSLDTQNGGDGSVIDDFQRFNENSKESLEQYNLWLKQFQDAAAASGISVLKPTNSTTSTPNSVSGAIKSITEETAGILASQIGAIRITQADTNQAVRESLVFLSNISSNSNYLSYLKSMDERLGRIESNGKSDPLRAKGV